MNVAVIGAAGWLGRAVLESLAGRHQVRAFDYGPQAWAAWEDVEGKWGGGEVVHGDITDFATVDRVLDGVHGVIHTAAYFGGGDDDPQPFLINLKGLWNTLEAAHRRGISRVVHIGSCQTVHPGGVFFNAEVRRPDAGLYAVTKRLQEEMCRQFHDAHGMSIFVLRPDYIVDSRLGLGRHREKLGPEGSRTRNGWVCRHDLAEACRLALEKEGEAFEVLHIVGTPEAEKTCNVGRARQVLGLEFRGDLEQYR